MVIPKIIGHHCPYVHCYHFFHETWDELYDHSLFYGIPRAQKRSDSEHTHVVRTAYHFSIAVQLSIVFKFVFLFSFRFSPPARAQITSVTLRRAQSRTAAPIYSLFP